MSVDEVEALIPELNFIFQRLTELRREIVSRATELERLGHDPASPLYRQELPPRILDQRRILEASVAAFEAELGRIGTLGGVLQDLELGLVDFHHVLDGDPVLLCWQFGETSVTHYHALDAGFCGRRRLPNAPQAGLPH